MEDCPTAYDAYMKEINAASTVATQAAAAVTAAKPCAASVATVSPLVLCTLSHPPGSICKSTQCQHDYYNQICARQRRTKTEEGGQPRPKVLGRVIVLAL
jgi:hypothetical protein